MLRRHCWLVVVVGTEVNKFLPVLCNGCFCQKHLKTVYVICVQTGTQNGTDAVKEFLVPLTRTSWDLLNLVKIDACCCTDKIPVCW